MNETELIKKYVAKEKQLEALDKLHKNYPVQYIIGDVDFYGLTIKVNENVLIPRFETELLVDKTLKYLSKLFPSKSIKIADLCTGSGCIAITLQHKLNCEIDAYDISKNAIEVAKENAANNKSKINFYIKDILKPIKGKYDCIISNPPYIRFDEAIAEPVKYEPKEALYAKNDGLEFYETILSYIKNNLNNKYLIAFECGETQAEQIAVIANKHLPDAHINIEKDFNNKNRFLFITSE